MEQHISSFSVAYDLTRSRSSSGQPKSRWDLSLHVLKNQSPTKYTSLRTLVEKIKLYDENNYDKLLQISSINSKS